jgi:hypothetical protein
MNLVNKDFLFETVFADLPQNWFVQATGFRYAADALIGGNTIAAGKQKCSTIEISLSNFALRVACYLQAHAIELYFKALYSFAKFPQEKATEELSHNINNLLAILRKKNVLPLQDPAHDKTTKLASLLLRWYGRYFKPKFSNSEDEKTRIINELFESTLVRNQSMLTAKYSVVFTLDSFTELRKFSEFLANTYSKLSPIDASSEIWLRINLF